jgi:hypothetical protein
VEVVVYLMQSTSATPPYSYDDAFPTCSETFSTLRIFSDDIRPNEITERLGLQPTKTYCKGELHGKGQLPRKTNGWYYTTSKILTSRDNRRHVDLILAALENKLEAINELHARGCKMDIMNYWVSASGEGGPWLMPPQMLKLGELRIQIWWDVYFRERLTDLEVV